jgi:hypothetical protein
MSTAEDSGFFWENIRKDVAPFAWICYNIRYSKDIMGIDAC